MKKILALIVFLSLCNIQPTVAQDDNFPTLWKNLTTEQKNIYLLGYKEGTEHMCSVAFKDKQDENTIDKCIMLFSITDNDAAKAAIKLIDYVYIEKNNTTISPSSMIFIATSTPFSEAKEIMDNEMDHSKIKNIYF